MTAAEDGLRAALAEALRNLAHWCDDADCASCKALSDDEMDATIWATSMSRHRATQIEASPEAIADALLPTVRAAMDQQAAEEVEAAAEEINEQRWRNRNGHGSARDAERIVRARADALRDRAAGQQGPE